MQQVSQIGTNLLFFFSFLPRDLLLGQWLEQHDSAARDLPRVTGILVRWQKLRSDSPTSALNKIRHCSERLSPPFLQIQI